MIAEAVEISEAQSPVRDETGPAVSRKAARDLVNGTGALGLAVLIERGFGFLANLLAARISGASTFGAYSLAITTANNVSTYAAGGIGSTAIRFSGKYSPEDAGYATLARALLIISTVSACAGALVLWAGAAPISRLLGKSTLTPLLEWTALSAAGMILLECCRGFLVGQRRVPAILLLSLTVGIGMITLIPLASRISPVVMIGAQGGIAATAVIACVLLHKPLGLAPTSVARHSEPLGPMLRTVWSFGLIQLAGLIGLNAAGWWLTSLIAHADTTMSQMGFFAIASQLRNIASLGPSLLTESSLAVMAQGEGDLENTPDRVMAVCTFATTLAVFLLAGCGMFASPWALPLLYGKPYAAASAATIIALATAIIHMASGPLAARLNILSIRLSGAINTVWAFLVAGGATLFLLDHGNAWKAALIYFAAHVLQTVLYLAILIRRNCVTKGVVPVLAVGGAGTLALLLLAAVRAFQPSMSLLVSALMLVALLATLISLLAIGRRHRWIPSVSLVRRLLRQRGWWPSAAISLTNSGGFDA